VEEGDRRAQGAEPLRLHLGCGERYLEGYVNIDFPESEHSVQAVRPDVSADIRRLDYPAGSVSEVRLHHVFEHFDRPTALRLLIDWRIWLTPGGTLVIETPDFERSATAFLLTTGGLGRLARGPLRRLVGHGRGTQLRHIFGSHEAAWAVHWDGWYKARYERTLPRLAYDSLAFRREVWQGTHNITVTARASSPAPPRDALLSAAEDLLRDSLVDDSESERRQHAHWVTILHG
jgi:predicted SAM-dependent methyltransferase